MGGLLLIVAIAGLLYVVYWFLKNRDGSLNAPTGSFLDMKQEPLDSEEESDGDSQA